MAVGRVRRAKQFFITLGNLEYYESIRQDFLEYFVGVEEYCVSVEQHHVNKRVHLHAFLLFKELVSCDDIRLCLSFHDSTVNVQVCRSRRNVLKYITKEDEEVFFNCRESELSFYYRSHAWARRTPAFRFGDSFVMEHPQYYRLLQQLHSEVQFRLRSYKTNIINVSTFWPGWCMQVLCYVRDCVRGRQKKGLYIYGRPGIGKTFIVSRVCKELGLSRVYLPVPGNFFFSDFRNSCYDIVLFEEWEYDTFKSNFYQIKRVLDGSSLPVDVKYSQRSVVCVKVPVVFVSNEYAFQDPAFLRRINIIDAIETMENVPRITVPKEEVDGMETEVVEIASETDESEEENVPPAVQGPSEDINWKKVKVLEKRILRPSNNTAVLESEESDS